MSYIGNSPATSIEVADNAITLAKMASGTDGNLITYDASGDPAYVTTGTSGHVLTSGGAGVAPTFQAAAGGGKVLQVVSSTTTGTVSGTNKMSDDSWATALSVSITPSSTSSKILIIYDLSIGVSNNDDGTCAAPSKLFRDSTGICIGDSAGSRIRVTTLGQYPRYNSFSKMLNMNYLDSPSTTSATTYYVKAAVRGTGACTWYMNRTGSDSNTSEGSRGASTITVMEIGA